MNDIDNAVAQIIRDLGIPGASAAIHDGQPVVLLSDFRARMGQIARAG